MRTNFIIYWLISVLLISCSDGKKNQKDNNSDATDQKTNFKKSYTYIDSQFKKFIDYTNLIFKNTYFDNLYKIYLSENFHNIPFHVKVHMIFSLNENQALEEYKKELSSNFKTLKSYEQLSFNFNFLKTSNNESHLSDSEFKDRFLKSKSYFWKFFKGSPQDIHSDYYLNTKIDFQSMDENFNESILDTITEIDLMAVYIHRMKNDSELHLKIIWHPGNLKNNKNTSSKLKNIKIFGLDFLNIPDMESGVFNLILPLTSSSLSNMREIIISGNTDSTSYRTDVSINPTLSIIEKNANNPVETCFTHSIFNLSTLNAKWPENSFSFEGKRTTIQNDRNRFTSSKKSDFMSVIDSNGEILNCEKYLSENEFLK